MREKPEVIIVGQGSLHGTTGGNSCGNETHHERIGRIMTVLDNVKKVVKELEATLTLLDKGQTERFIDTILAAQTIFIAGTGDPAS